MKISDVTREQIAEIALGTLDRDVTANDVADRIIAILEAEAPAYSPASAPRDWDADAAFLRNIVLSAPNWKQRLCAIADALEAREHEDDAVREAIGRLRVLHSPTTMPRYPDGSLHSDWCLSCDDDAPCLTYVILDRAFPEASK